MTANSICLKGIFLFIFSISSIGINAQETINNPVELYQEANNLTFQKGDIKKAKEIYDKLIAQFPEDLALYSQYEFVLQETEGREAVKQFAAKILPIFEKVPEANRTAEFYFKYLRFLKILDDPKAQNITAKIIEKYPKHRNTKDLMISSVDKADPVEAVNNLLKLIDENEEDGFYNTRIAENRFKLISDNQDIFKKSDLITAAEMFEKFSLKEMEPRYFEYGEIGYFRNLLDISDALRDKYPNESDKYLTKAVSFYKEKITKNNKLAQFKPLYLKSKIKTDIAMQNWNEAKNSSVEFIKAFDSVKEEYKSISIMAEVLVDYSLALEKLNQIEQAREQIATAVAYKRKYQYKLKEFNTKYPLSSESLKSFEQKIAQQMEPYFRPLEEKAKLKLSKELTDKPAIDFTITDLLGNNKSLANYKGRVLIVNFWATWCVPCLYELEEMKIAFDKYANNPKVAFAIVNTDEDKKLVPPMIKKQEYNFPIYYASDKMTIDYKLQAIPLLVIIDSNGKIRFEKRGDEDDGLFLKRLDMMIEMASK